MKLRAVAALVPLSLALVLVGAALLLSSLFVFGYSQATEWQHQVQQHALAPAREALPDRLPLPTPRPR